MSNLVNRHWINFDGEPVTGRTPPSILVYGPPMTPQQFGEVAHIYKLFTDANLVAIGDYQVRNRVLRDGTRVRCLSINGVDTVYVWTSGGEENAPVLFEGFVFIPYEPLAFGNYVTEPTHRVWGSPFNEGNPFGTPYEVNALSAVAIVPSELGGSAQSILMPVEKKGVEGEYEWKHYRWPTFKMPMRDIVRAGNLDWKGPPIKGLSDYPVITWYGPPSRGLNYSYWIDDEPMFDTTINQGSLANSLFRNEVYFRGAVLAKAPYPVQGAALRVFDEKLWLVVVTFYFEEVGQDDYLNVHEHLYIKQVRLYDVAPLIDYHKGGKDQNDPGLYDPETKPYGWKLLAQRTYQAANRLAGGFIGVTEAPFHGYFFNRSATEASAAVLQGVPRYSPPDPPLDDYPGVTVFRKQTWSVTNEGYGSAASFSHGPYRSDLFSIDYDGDRLVEGTVTWNYVPNDSGPGDRLVSSDLYIDGGYIHTFPLNDIFQDETYIGFIDLRHNIIVYGNRIQTVGERNSDLFFRRGGSVLPLPSMDYSLGNNHVLLANRPSRYTSSLDGYAPQVQCATYKDFCLFSISVLYTEAALASSPRLGERHVYFSEGDLLEYLGENPLPGNYALEALRII